MKKILLSLFLLFFSIAVFSEIKHKILVFATDPNYPPFENYSGVSDQIIGYDVDIVHALCRKMVVSCKFIEVPFNELIPRLKKGEYDAIIRALSITPTRMREIDFSNSYFDTPGSFITRADSKISFKQLESFMGKVFGAQENTTFGDYLKIKFDHKINIDTYKNIEYALNDLSAGNLDVVLGDRPVIINWLESQTPGDYKIIGITGPDKDIFGYGFGIGVKKGNAKLLKAINQAIDDIKKDGTYDQITQQFFTKTNYWSKL